MLPGCFQDPAVCGFRGRVWEGGYGTPSQSTGRERSEHRERGVWGANFGIGDFLISGVSQLQGFKKLQGNYREEPESLDAKRAEGDWARPFMRKSATVYA